MAADPWWPTSGHLYLQVGSILVAYWPSLSFQLVRCSSRHAQQSLHDVKPGDCDDANDDGHDGESVLISLVVACSTIG